MIDDLSIQVKSLWYANFLAVGKVMLIRRTYGDVKHNFIRLTLSFMKHILFLVRAHERTHSKTKPYQCHFAGCNKVLHLFLHLLTHFISCFMRSSRLYQICNRFTSKYQQHICIYTLVDLEVLVFVCTRPHSHFFMQFL
jgi:hypothetical protein